MKVNALAVAVICASAIAAGCAVPTDHRTRDRVRRNPAVSQETDDDDYNVPGRSDAGTSTNPRKVVFGTLGALKEHAKEEAAAGISRAMIHPGWDVLEPVENEINRRYLQEVTDNVEAEFAAGRSITLTLAFHYFPKWVLDLPDSRMVDDEGTVSTHPNFVFNQRVRDKAERFFARVASSVDFSKIAAIRVLSGVTAELLYPSKKYWAFDRNAQNGPDMPPTMAKNPAPGWRPGQPGLSEAQMRTWAEWYIGGLVDLVNWQIATLSRLGFRGDYEVMTPGWGLRPREYEDVIRKGLPHSYLGNGAVWHVLYGKLPKRSDIVAYVSSVADLSGDDECAYADGSVPSSSPIIESWSATRLIAWSAHNNGYAVAGENPGFACPSCPPNPRLDASYLDLGEKGMMAMAFRQLRSCRFKAFYWAHDIDLWNGRIPFHAYADRIASEWSR